MKSFEYAAPASLEEAVALLGETWGETEILAGGTDLITSMKQRITTPRLVVSLRNISELRGIRAEEGKVQIGATTPLADVRDHEAIRKHFPGIAQAIDGIGSEQIISMGTIGGDLCQRPRCWYFRNGYGLFGKEADRSLVLEGDNRYHAIFGNSGPAYFVSPSSLGPILIALGATIIAGGKGQANRRIPADKFFQTPRTERDRETVLKPNEILTAIEIPIRGLKNATYEVKHRHGLDWPYVAAAVAFPGSGGSGGEAKVVLGHVAPVPWVSEAASKVLQGGAPDESLAQKCGEAAVQGAKPLSRNAYKVPMVKTAVKRAILGAAKA